MNPPRYDILFLIRAYNDLDIQLSLIESFAKDERAHLRVVGYPCDGNMGSPQAHEAAQYMSDKYGVRFETVLDHAPAPLYLRLLYRLERFLAPMRNSALGQHLIFGFPLKVLHVGVLSMMRACLSGNLPWLDRVMESWSPQSIIIDEAFIQPGRSYMIDHVLPQKIAGGAMVHMIQTGQTVYFDAAPNKAAVKKRKQTTDQKIETRSAARRFIVPSALDREIVKKNFPQEEPEVHGNLRMDKAWIHRLHKDILIPPYLDKPQYMHKLPQTDGPKVVFMLSKLGYGIKLDELKATLRAVAKMDGVACAIKPHTRGMKFDFMSPSELRGAVIVPDIPSTLLIEWADILLFTGSSISFHAMMLEKRVGFLQNCQYIKTIFDDGVACDKFNSVKELTLFLKNWRAHGAPEITNEERAVRQAWQADHIHGGLENGLTADHYRDLILGDIKP